MITMVPSLREGQSDTTDSLTLTWVHSEVALGSSPASQPTSQFLISDEKIIFSGPISVFFFPFFFLFFYPASSAHTAE